MFQLSVLLFGFVPRSALEPAVLLLSFQHLLPVPSYSLSSTPIPPW